MQEEEYILGQLFRGRTIVQKVVRQAEHHRLVFMHQACEIRRRDGHTRVW